MVAQRDHDVVMGKYRQRRHPFLKRLTSRIKNWFDSALAGKPRDLVSNPYRVHKASVIQAICRMQGPYPFISAMMYYATHDIVQVEVEHGERTGRPSQFNLRRRLKSYTNLIINRSAFLIRAATILGLTISMVAVGAGLYLLIDGVVGDGSSGWNALLVALTFTNGMVLFALGVVGEYATRILVGVERRPPYLVRETIG